MEWWLAALIIFGGLAVVMFSGVPVAFGFMVVNVVGVYIFWGGEAGLRQLILSLYGSITHFTLLPLVLFSLMGVALFESGLGTRAIDGLDKVLGSLPGRLSLLSVGGGTIFAALSGNSMATTALLGTLLTPDMERRGYKKLMSLGPIMASGGLATMIPPSGLAVFIAALGEFSVGDTLIGGAIPGLIMAALYGLYIVGVCWLRPSLAPSYEVPHIPLTEKLTVLGISVLPLGAIMFLVTGVILVGIATPSEAAATGLVGTLIVAACYRRLDWQLLKKSIKGGLEIGVMVYMILTGSVAFSQILSFSGATQGLIALILGFPVPPFALIIMMQVFYLFLGSFMGAMEMFMISFPIFLPIVRTLGFDPVWFGVLSLLNAEIASLSPPFGGVLFVMKGVSPPHVTMADVYRASIPFIIIDVAVLTLLVAFPQLVLWLPSMVH